MLLFQILQYFDVLFSHYVNDSDKRQVFIQRFDIE